MIINFKLKRFKFYFSFKNLRPAVNLLKAFIRRSIFWLKLVCIFEMSVTCSAGWRTSCSESLSFLTCLTTVFIVADGTGAFTFKNIKIIDLEKSINLSGNKKNDFTSYFWTCFAKKSSIIAEILPQSSWICVWKSDSTLFNCRRATCVVLSSDRTDEAAPRTDGITRRTNWRDRALKMC